MSSTPAGVVLPCGVVGELLDWLHITGGQATRTAPQPVGRR
jgi:hypothetical protein